MSKLLALQTEFLATVKSDGPVDSLPIFEANGIRKETRVGIYRHAYWSRITDSLAEDFPKTDKFLCDRLFSFEDLVHDFMTSEKNNFASIGELSKAFFIYVISTNQRMNQLPIWEINRFVKVLRTDYACLMCSFSPWSLNFDEYTSNCLRADQITETENIAVVWNKSLQIFDTVFVFQKDGDVTILDAAERSDIISNEGLSPLFELLDTRRNITTFDQLIDEMARLKFDEKNTQATIQFLTENELLFFTRAH